MTISKSVRSQTVGRPARTGSWRARLVLAAMLCTIAVAFDLVVLDGRLRREVLSGSILHEPANPEAQVRRTIERARTALWDAVRP